MARPASARALLSPLDGLRRQHGLTVLSVLNDPVLAREFADRVLTLERGRLSPLTAATSSDGAAASRAVEALGSAPTPVSLDATPASARGVEPQFAAARAGAGARVERCVGDLVPDAAEWQRIDWAALAVAMRDTLLTAWLATLAAVALSLPLAAAAARNVAPPWLRVPTRAILNAIRAVPSLLWALLAVGAFGLGALPGVVVLGIYSLGYLTKFYYEALEATPREVPAVLRALDMGGAQTFLAAILPASRLALLSASVFMLEHNFRTATVLGVVGAGGIGYELKLAIDWGNWHVVGVIVAGLIVAVTLFNALAARLRRALG